MSSPEDFERRPNPKGWVQPKAPYNPYDPFDQRPAQGYPSEFNAPEAVKKNSGSIARNLDDYQRMKLDMKTLQYYPRPPSEKYPGRYKVLRRVNSNNPFTRGANLTAKVSIYGFVAYAVFFYKWNDHENIFAPFRRCQLYLKEAILGQLDEEDYNDLYHYDANKAIPQRPLPSRMYDKNVEGGIAGEGSVNNEHIVDRFGTKHVVFAEHLNQESDAEKMAKLDEMLRQRQLELESMQSNLQQQQQQSAPPKSSSWRFW